VKLTAEQRQEIERLAGQMEKLREQITVILDLADDLGKDTIEKVMAKSDAEQGFEFLLNQLKDNHS
jgi:translation initiation factor 2 beta subunit (eIF-2beta)/eIF-5